MVYFTSLSRKIAALLVWTNGACAFVPATVPIYESHTPTPSTSKKRHERQHLTLPETVLFGERSDTNNYLRGGIVELMGDEADQGYYEDDTIAFEDFETLRLNLINSAMEAKKARTAEKNKANNIPIV
eukprot:CAMPEP_0171309976 /NCGR_PEP_ID=MMETSP0816-20121228/20176_1 /TAXON_ID=420281 /ORGANISM="Proboscia inermis, Strain CCAP1064/1" /LENGTH=127 /DNA_ID=CAMNT_0011793857 /DNA_START=166 /DNA_END=550 /DNA_ORIENTATION=+